MTDTTYEQYASPADLAADDQLSPEQKITLLKQWEFDQLCIEVADEENMAGSDSTDRLQEIRQALAALHADNNAIDDDPTKL